MDSFGENYLDAMTSRGNKKKKTSKFFFYFLSPNAAEGEGNGITHTSHHKKRICPEHQLRKTDDGVQELSRSDSNCFKTTIDQIVVAVKSFWPFDSKSVFYPEKEWQREELDISSLPHHRE
eukprot:scaffold34922_cov141-Amphora_coffeaeformis.AAC.6